MKWIRKRQKKEQLGSFFYLVSDVDVNPERKMAAIFWVNGSVGDSESLYDDGL